MDGMGMVFSSTDTITGSPFSQRRRFPNDVKVGFSDLEQVKHLAMVVGDLDQLGGAVVAHCRAGGSGRPATDAALKCDHIVFGDLGARSCH